jgi:hypothetical protein
MLSWTALSSVITTVSWIPWALWAVLQFHGRAEAKAAPLEFRSIALLSLIVAMMFLGGHLQFAAYGVGAVVLLMLFQLRELRARAFGVLFGVGFGVMIAFPQLLPVLKHSADSHRRNVPTEAGYEAFIASAIKPFEFANLVTPKALGDPRTPVEVGQGMTVAEYWPPLAKQGANFAESAVTIGPLVLGSLFLVPWRERRTWPIATIGILALLFAMGTVLNKILYFGLPGWSSTGSPGRIIVLFVLAVCVLAGLAVREVSKRQALVALVSMALITLLTVFILPGLHPSWQAGMEQLGQSVVGIGGAGLLPAVAISIVLGMGVMLLIPHAKKVDSLDSTRLFPVIPVLLVVAAGLGLIPTGKPVEAVKGPEDPHSRVAIVNENWGIIAAAKEALMPPNLAALSRIRELGGYDSLLNKNTKRILDEINQQDSAPPANGNIMFAKPTAYWESLVDAGVSDVWSNREIDLKGNFDMRQENGIYKYRLQSYDQDVARATVGRNPATFLVDSGNQMLLEATGPGTLSVADRNLPGWSVTVDGKDAAISPGDFLAVELPAGKHQVDFRYVAPAFGLGLIIGLPAFFGGISRFALRRPSRACWMIVPGITKSDHPGCTVICPGPT